MKLSEIPFDEIKIGQRVQSDTMNMTGTVDRTYTDENRYGHKNPFVVIEWDDQHISHVAYNWGLWMKEITVMPENKIRLNKMNFNSIRIGQRIHDDGRGIDGRVVGGEIGYNRNDSDTLTIEWYHSDGSIEKIVRAKQYCDYVLIEEDKQSTESVPCDHCHKEITDFENDLVHVAGIINGEFNNHIHLCKSCFERLKVPEIDLDALRKAANFYTTRRPKTV